jgi:hypothetical protein
VVTTPQEMHIVFMYVGRTYTNKMFWVSQTHNEFVPKKTFIYIHMK